MKGGGEGGGGGEVGGVARWGWEGETHVVFGENRARLEQAIASSAGAIIAAEFAANAKATKPILIVADPRLAFARAARLLHHRRRQHPGVHSTAEVHHSAKMGKAVSIGPHPLLRQDRRLPTHTPLAPHNPPA